MNTKVKHAIIAAARAEPTIEVCGFIVHSDHDVFIHPCTNVSRDPSGHSRTFEADPQDYIAASARGKVCGLYHSHPHGPAAFSEEDLLVAREWELPSYLYVVEGGAWLSYIPDGYVVPLTGQPFIWGEHDCLSTVIIYYRQKMGIYLTDYPRDETFREAAPDAILQHISDEGFVNLGGSPTLAREHDVLLFNTPGHRFPHHLGVYLGGNRVLHHPYGGLSRIDDLDGAMLGRLLGVLRCGRIAAPQPPPSSL